MQILHEFLRLGVDYSPTSLLQRRSSSPPTPPIPPPPNCLQEKPPDSPGRWALESCVSERWLDPRALALLSGTFIVSSSKYALPWHWLHLQQGHLLSSGHTGLAPIHRPSAVTVCQWKKPPFSSRSHVDLEHWTYLWDTESIISSY